MLFWLFIIILAYLFFSFSFFGDKLVLSGPPNPRLYTFYVAAMGLIVVIFLPFVSLRLPDPMSLLWIVLDSFAYVLALYAMFLVLGKFEVSRVVTTIGAIQPI